MAKQSRITTDALEIIHQRYYAGRPHRLDQLQEAIANDDVARKIYDLRAQAGLTQKQLAGMIGTTPSVISRLEDADYEGHSLAMLNRIAAALNKRVRIDFVPVAQKRRSAWACLHHSVHFGRLNDDGKTVAAMDVLAPGIGEIGGGSQREERLDRGWRTGRTSGSNR
jgi:transcriptional regulator with XRE-family HTH domain